MKKFQNFLSLGILFIMLGIILLVIGSSGFESGVFFIFPFFFGSSEFVSIFLVLAFVYLMIIIVSRSVPFFLGQSDSVQTDSVIEKDLPIRSWCEYCSELLPVNAVFCPRCGNQTSRDTMSDR